MACSAAICTLATHFAPGQEPPATNELQHSASESYETRGRRHPSYQVFAIQCVLPSISSTGQVVEIDQKFHLEVPSAAPLPDESVHSLAQSFGVPPELVVARWERYRTNSRATPKQVAASLRTDVVDYKYLASRWAAYQPNEAGMQIKSNGITALNAGDLARAWELYATLPRPSAPRSQSPDGP